MHNILMIFFFSFWFVTNAASHTCCLPATGLFKYNAPKSSIIVQNIYEKLTYSLFILHVTTKTNKNLWAFWGVPFEMFRCFTSSWNKKKQNWKRHHLSWSY